MGPHVTIGVIFLILMGRKVWRGDFDQNRRGFFTSRTGSYEIVEITGLVLALRRSGLGVHLRLVLSVVRPR